MVTGPISAPTSALLDTISSLCYREQPMKPDIKKKLLIPFIFFIAVGIACVRPAPARLTPTEGPAPTASGTPAPSATPIPSPTLTPAPQARIQSGDHALLNGDWEAAQQEYQKVFDSRPGEELEAMALIGLARAHWMGRNPYETERIIEQLLTNYPLSEQRPFAHFLLAQVRIQQERYAEAAQAFSKYMELRPNRIDAYVTEWRGDTYSSQAEYALAVKDYEAALLSGQRDDTSLRLKLAQSYALAGDDPTALTLYDDLYQRDSDANTRAIIDLRKAEIYLRAGREGDAIAAYQDAVQNYPTSGYAHPALVALVERGVPVDELQRGIIDYFAGEYGVAQAAFDRYLQAEPPDPATAHYYYGLSARQLGELGIAIQHWDVVLRDYVGHSYWDEAAEQKAYTQWYNLDLYDEAVVTLLDMVKTAANHPRAAEFINDAAIVSERAGKLAQAANLWEQLVREYPTSDLQPRGLFLSGITHYRLGDYVYALDAFQRTLVAAPDAYERSAAGLWIGKCYLKLDNLTAAQAALDEAVNEDPTGYYSERARDMLYNRPPFDPPLSYDLAFDLPTERQRATIWLRSTFSIPPETDLSSLGNLVDQPAWQRGDELWRLGLYDEASLEFENLRLSLQEDPAALFALTNYLSEIGAYRSSIMTARQILDRAGMDDASTLDAPAYFSHVRFGPYYSDLVLPLAREYNLHPLLIFSVIRQESLFEGFVRSSAGANGLMQIIPSTGQHIAQNLGWPDDYATADLVRPVVNLRLGTDYLNGQKEYFDGDWYAALAAYNAGPGNAGVWKELAPDDPDLFLEVIRYSETRNYIRGIYEIFAIYRNLYDRQP